MMNDENRELEERLRALPTAGPPAALKEEILRRAAQTARPRRKTGLAFALCILGLLVLDIGVDKVQSARIARLTGRDQPVIASANDKTLMVALLQQRMTLESLSPAEELP